MQPPSTGETRTNTPTFAGALLWGIAILGFAGWVAPAHLGIATLNLGGRAPSWLEWPYWFCLLLAPALEGWIRRRRAIVRLQILSATFILAAAGLLLASRSIKDVWLPLAFGAVTGELATMIGWAIFAQHVPERRRAWWLFAANLGMAITATTWTGGLLGLMGMLHRLGEWGWDWVWVVVITAWAVITCGLALLSRLTLPADTSDRIGGSGPELGSVKSRPTDPLPTALAAYREVWTSFLAIGGLKWLLAFQAVRALGDALQSHLESDGLLRIYNATNAEHGAETLGLVTSVCALFSVGFFPIVARLGIERCWRPLVVTVSALSVLFVLEAWNSAGGIKWVLLAVGSKRLLGIVLATAWVLYALRVVGESRFVLTHYAWMAALPLATDRLARLLFPGILPVTNLTALTAGLLLLVPLTIHLGYKAALPLKRANVPDALEPNAQSS